MQSYYGKEYHTDTLLTSSTYALLPTRSNPALEARGKVKYPTTVRGGGVAEWSNAASC